jgi:hypothetical protein
VRSHLISKLISEFRVANPRLALSEMSATDEARPKLPGEPHRRCRVNSNPLTGSAINGYTYQDVRATALLSG